MLLSPYFHNLRTAYVAELDDMALDSEGVHILNQRLAQRRQEIDFLVHMLDISPEMVAVVFHKAFHFQSRTAMEHVLSRESEELPEWDTVSDTIGIEPWAQSLVATIRKQPLGDWFLTVAAGLEYLVSRHDAVAGHDLEDPFAIGPEDTDADEYAEAQARDEAGADWLAEQGFDRKESP